MMAGDWLQGKAAHGTCSPMASHALVALSQLFPPVPCFLVFASLLPSLLILRMRAHAQTTHPRLLPTFLSQLFPLSSPSPPLSLILHPPNSFPHEHEYTCPYVYRLYEHYGLTVGGIGQTYVPTLPPRMSRPPSPLSRPLQHARTFAYTHPHAHSATN